MNGVPVIVSLSVHIALFVIATRFPNTPPPLKKKTVVEMKVIEPPPSPSATPEPPPPPPPPPKAEPKIKKAPDKAPPASAEPPPPPPVAPPPPPVFSLDMESTVSGGDGPAVKAVENGGNMFADPKTPGTPGPKVEERVAPQVGRGTDPTARGEGRIEPKPITPDRDVRPPYTDEAREREIEGQLRLRILIGADGKIEQIKVVKSLGYGMDEAAIKHIKAKWKFEPARNNGVPFATWIDVPITYELER